MINIYLIGQKIAELRKQNNMTQEDLAEKLCVTRQAVSKWESGRTAPSIEALISLSILFGVHIEELLCLNHQN